MRWKWWLFLLMLPGGLLAQTPQKGELVLAYGAFDLRKNTIADARLEYRFGQRLLVFQPIVGVLATSDGSRYGYAGFNYAVPLNNVLSVSLNLAAGAYGKGPSKELGGVLEFRSGIELVLFLTSKIQLSWSFHHLSNASLYDYNPGVETLMYSLHFRDVF